jgi:AcrR family transcriptional regulator
MVVPGVGGSVAESKSVVKAVKPKRGRPAGGSAGETRASIVSAGRIVLGARGRRAATVRMVADQAGLSNTAVYYYFAGIDDIHDAVVADVSSVMKRSVRDVLNQPTLLAQIRHYVLAMRRLDVEDRSLMPFVMRDYLDVARGPKRKRKGSLLMATTDLIGAMVGNAVERGELAADVDQRAIVGLLSSILWGVQLYAGFADDADAVARVSNYLDVVLGHGVVRGPANSNALAG